MCCNSIPLLLMLQKFIPVSGCVVEIGFSLLLKFLTNNDCVCHYYSAGTEGEHKIQCDMGERASSCWRDKFHCVHL